MRAVVLLVAFTLVDENYEIERARVIERATFDFQCSAAQLQTKVLAQAPTRASAARRRRALITSTARAAAEGS
jgi:hypothetical protein